MKSLSIIFAILLLILANLLALHLKRAGKLPAVPHERQNSVVSDLSAVSQASPAGIGAASQP